MQAAQQLLEQGDGGQVRMSDIAKAAKISRQGLYLHFATRAELLVALTRWMDEVNDVDRRLAASRQARDGETRLAAFVEAWGNYIPMIHGVGRALMAMSDSDAEAAAAWAERMQAVRHGCAAAVAALKDQGVLRDGLSEERATDLFWTLMSVRNWEQLRQGCGWTQADYVVEMQRLARAALVELP
ncbi:helix-turn-helix domain-containing protein [Aliisedimentitalea sp. MJ-SS2]|uniref:TetR/AcrR family transcriptional regulator n=1 Tax=Aliisedimentitalea sp. MJ-SS2 TaxID=3049795 RepID=UPI00292F48C8|nr:helix-turn-helix domain-containing protein [Alisedimentitalea sp. MJ-SS2]